MSVCTCGTNALPASDHFAGCGAAAPPSRVAPYYDEDGITIYHGDCRDVDIAPESVDLLLTDPPYGMAFVSGWTAAKATGSGRASKDDMVTHARWIRPGVEIASTDEADAICAYDWLTRSAVTEEVAS